MQPKTFVINLKHRIDRRRQMQTQLSRVGWSAEFFDAIHPSTAADFPSIGARGCFLSHLAVLEKARDAGLPRVVILEDDVNFCADFANRWAVAMAAIAHFKWSVFYPGHILQSPTSGLARLDPSTSIQCTHFMMVDGSAIGHVIEGLKEILSRPAGHPRGGPMHVDGAYSTVRAQNAALITYAFFPVLGYQRPSRTDIGDLKWFDRNRALAPAVKIARRIRTLMHAR